MPQKYDFSDVPDSVVPEFHRLASETLDGTIQIALAADVRATTLAGIFGGASVALLAAIATILAGNSAPYHILLLPSFVASFCLFVAATLCAWSSRPIDFFMGGYEPRLIQESAKDMNWMLRFATEDIQTRIDANKAALSTGAKFLQCGMAIAMLGVVAAVIIVIYPWVSLVRSF
jgi:hypothetical protein